MNTLSKSIGMNPLEAYASLMQFAQLRGEQTLKLAMHASVPQVFRPELLHLLKLNFVPDAPTDFTTEADILLADFCIDIGNGFYQFDTEVRQLLLRDLDATYAASQQSRVVYVAEFLIKYVQYSEQYHLTPQTRTWWNYIFMNEWIALSFLSPDEAAEQLAAALNQTIDNYNTIGKIQIGGLAAALSSPLSKHHDLLTYAMGIQLLEAGQIEAAEDLLSTLEGSPLLIGRIKLKSPQELLKDSDTYKDLDEDIVIRRENKFELGGALNSDVNSLYINRGIEDAIWQRIGRGGSFVAIVAPRQMGKSSLMMMLGNMAENNDHLTVKLDLSTLASDDNYTNLLRDISQIIAKQLHLETNLDHIWSRFERENASLVISDFLEELFTKIDGILSVFIDEFDAIVGKSYISEFLQVLRSWNIRDFRNRLNVILFSVIPPSHFDNTSLMSPLANIVQTFYLRPFTLQQVHELVRRASADIVTEDLQRIYQYFGGHPYLLQVALNSYTQNSDVELLIRQASQPDSIFSAHLHYLNRVIQNTDGGEALVRQLLLGQSPTNSEAIENLVYFGILQRDGSEHKFTNSLYEDYFTNIYQTIRHRFFISYSREEGKEFAQEIGTRISDRFGEQSVWRDTQSLRAGESWQDQIQEALQRIDYLITIMTPSIVNAEHVAMEWTLARRRGVCMVPVVPSGKILDYGDMPRWMSKVHFYDFNIEPNTQWEALFRHLSNRCQRRPIPFNVPDIPSNFVSPEETLENLLNQILDKSRSEPVTTITSLTGAGGFGKTVIAAAVCHYYEVQAAYEDGILWIQLGQEPDLMTKLINFYSLLGGIGSNFEGIQGITAILQDMLREKRVLLVLDDVWNFEHVKPFIEMNDIGTIIITTRSAEIAHEAQAYAPRVPTDLVEEDESSSQNTADASVKSTFQILIVNDNDGERSRLADLMQQQGWTVTEATTNASAREHLVNSEFDLVITDVERTEERYGEKGNLGLDLVVEIQDSVGVIIYSYFDEEKIRELQSGLQPVAFLNRRDNDDYIVNIIQAELSRRSPLKITGNSLEELFQDLVRALTVRYGPATIVYIGLLDNGNIRFPFANIDMRNLSVDLTSDNIGIVGYVAKQNQATIYNHGEDTSKYSPYIFSDKQMLSELSIPLSKEGNVYGVLSIEHPSQSVFTQTDIDLLAPIASTLTQSISETYLSQPQNSRKARILIADPLREWTRILNDNILANFPYVNVIVANSFDDANQSLQTDSFDLVVTEIRFDQTDPDDLRGIQLVKEFGKTVPMLVLTSYSTATVVREVMGNRQGEGNALNFFDKREGVEQVIGAIRQQIDPQQSTEITVGSLSSEQALTLLLSGIDPSANASSARLLVDLLGNWPLMLSLANGILKMRMSTGSSPDEAIAYIVEQINTRGLDALQLSDEDNRSQSLANVLAASLGLLNSEQRNRLLELSVFPEDTQIPLAIIQVLWRIDDRDTEDTVKELHSYGLIRFDVSNQVVSMHDLVRTALRNQLSEVENETALHRSIVQHYQADYYNLDDYGWQNLSYHMFHADSLTSLRKLLLDVEWVKRKVTKTDANSLLKDYQYFEQDEELNQIVEIVRNIRNEAAHSENDVLHALEVNLQPHLIAIQSRQDATELPESNVERQVRQMLIDAGWDEKPFRLAYAESIFDKVADFVLYQNEIVLAVVETASSNLGATTINQKRQYLQSLAFTTNARIAYLVLGNEIQQLSVSSVDWKVISTFPAPAQIIEQGSSINIAQFLVDIRSRHQLTQAELAEIMTDVDAGVRVHQRDISAYETGGRVPSRVSFMNVIYFARDKGDNISDDGIKQLLEIYGYTVDSPLQEDVQVVETQSSDTDIEDFPEWENEIDYLISRDIDDARTRLISDLQSPQANIRWMAAEKLSNIAVTDSWLAIQDAFTREDGSSLRARIYNLLIGDKFNHEFLIDQHTKSFISMISPLEEKYTFAEEQIKYFEGRIRRNEDASKAVRRVVLFGSLARNTAIRSESDVDILVLFRVKDTEDPTVVFEVLEVLVKAVYPNQVIERKNTKRGSSFTRSVLVDLPQGWLEFVPGVIASNKQIVVPFQQKNTWKPTNHLVHKEYTDKQNSLTNGAYSDVVRIFKWWKRYRFNKDIIISGFALECLIASNSHRVDFSSSALTSFHQIMQNIHERVTGRGGIRNMAFIPELGVVRSTKYTGITTQQFEMFVQELELTLKILSELSNDVTLSKKIEIWHEVFGDQFPKTL